MSLTRLDFYLGVVAISAAIVFAGLVQRFEVTSGGPNTAWRIDRLTGEVRACRDFGGTHESLCENPAQFLDPSL